MILSAPSRRGVYGGPNERPEGSHRPMTEPTWTRSSFCAESACVEVALVDGDVIVRDSKDVSRPPLRLPLEAWRAFRTGIADGDFRFDDQP